MRTLKTLIAVATLAALTACGGGGGGGSDATGGPAPVVPVTPVAPVDVVASTGTLATTAAAATYEVASIEADAYSALNAARGGAGAGVLQQSTQIDVAALSHAKYREANMSSPDAHGEVPGTLYYEATVGSRIKKSGFLASASTEVIGGTGFSKKGSDCMLGLLNTVYHGAALLGAYTHVGIGFSKDSGGTPMCVADLATDSALKHAQVAPAGSLVAYPYNGQAGVMETFYVGYESPRPSAALFPNLTAGTPVLVNVRNADFVNALAAGTLNAAVTKFELKDAGGNLVPASILANSSLRGVGVTLNADALLAEGFAILVPLSPLLKGATYTATFSATLKSGGPQVSKTWSFTTTQ